MNRLGNETSPYLLQHKNNPVHWYPWGEEALERAKSQNKPIILSIGYSACHWCHVMEHESFEDKKIAHIMNDNFICIKVDREERPDIDAVYMEAIQAMRKQGGWPLNMFLLPDTKPFFGGTYFQKNNWETLLLNISQSFKLEPEALYSHAENITNYINVSESDKFNFGQISSSDYQFSAAEINKLIRILSENFDVEHGGIGFAPKFPMPSIWLFVINYLADNKNISLLTHLKLSLDRMVLGGIFDHLEGGWTRYATEGRWKIPHFEKMAYDNGLLLSVYAKAIQLFEQYNIYFESRYLYQNAVELTVEWFKNNLLEANGGFFAALDADSEGEEGKYYVWTKVEIAEILNKDAVWYGEKYEITTAGNWEDKKNILHLEKFLSEAEFEKLNRLNKQLLIERNKRVKPSLDTKQISSLNGIVVNGLIDAKTILPNLDLDIKSSIEFIENELISEKSGQISLVHQKNKVWGFLDDYAFVIQAFVNYYQTFFDEKILFKAENLLKYCIENFYDETENLFNFTENSAEVLIARKKEIFDNVIPSSNAIMAQNLYYLGRIFENQEYLEISKTMLAKFKPLLLKESRWLSAWANLAVIAYKAEIDIVILGKDYKDVATEIIHKLPLSNVLVFASENPIALPHFDGKKVEDNETLIFVCKNKTCDLPVKNTEEALKNV